MLELILVNCIIYGIYKYRNTEKIIKSTEEVPMTMLKEKLLTDNIKGNGEMFSSINPL